MGREAHFMVIEAATQQQERSTRAAALVQQADSMVEARVRRALAEVRPTAAEADPWDPRVQPQAVAEEDPNSSRLTLI